MSTTGGSVPGRQALQIGQGEVRELGDIGVGVGAGLEIRFDDADAQQGTRFHVIHAAGLGEQAFQRIGDIGFDIHRGHAVVERRHHDHRQIDGRETDPPACGMMALTADHRQRQAAARR